MPGPHIQVVLAEERVPVALRAALQSTSATASFWPLAEAVRGGPSEVADAVVVVVPDEAQGVAAALRRLFDRLAERPRATLVLTSSGQPAAPVEHPAALPVAFGSGLSEHDLAVHLGAMLAMRQSLDCLHRRAQASRQSGESVATRYARQLRLASQVQRGFLPESLPPVGPVSFEALFCPVDYVSGDIYDVHRLDEAHVGLAVADATGHGIPAALLTVYIKRALRGKEIEQGSYRILPPDEVLRRLNDDILDAGLSECPFVAAVYAVLNTRTLELALARAGAPYPLLRRACGRVEVLESSGPVVGVAERASFEVLSLTLRHGDALLLYSDGLERVVAPQEAAEGLPAARPEPARQVAAGTEAALVGAAAPVAPAAAVAVAGGTPDDAGPAGPAVPAPPVSRHLVVGSPFCRTLRERGAAAALEQVRGRQRALRRMGYPLDDLTVLAASVAR